jgi:hypothetical protein
MLPLDLRLPAELQTNFTNTEIRAHFMWGIECCQTQRKVFKLDDKRLEHSYRLEIGTRLCFAQFLQKIEEYEEATAEIGKAIQLAQEHHIEVDFEKYKVLIEAINELRDANLKAKLI